MAENKKALIRYLTYDACLNNTKRKYTYVDLIKYANEALLQHDLKPIGKSQFYKDIEFMRYGHWKAPIATYNIGRNKYYKYTENYSINNALSEAQVSQEVADFFRNISVYSPFRNMKWYAKLPSIIKDNTVHSNPIIGFDMNELYKGHELIELIIQAVINKKVLNITYQTTAQENNYTIHPYYLKVYNNRWYLLAKIEGKEEIKSFSIHNITHLNIEDEYFQDANLIDFNTYFKDMIGIGDTDCAIEDIELLVTTKDLPFFISKPLHPSQTHVLLEDDKAIVNIKVICNRSLENLLLSYGERIQILKPSHLKERISQRLAEALALYKGK